MSFRDNHVRLDTDGRVDEDLICLGCGYNLRSLTLDRACPECGTAVGRSAIGNKLTYANPDWVSKLSLGTTLMAIHIVLVIFAAVVAASGLALQPEEPTPFDAVIFAGLIILEFIAYWLFTAPEPNVTQDVRSRQVARIAIAIGVAWRLVEIVAPPLHWNNPAAAIVLQLAGALAQLVAMFASFVYAAHLARRIPDEPLAQQTRTVMWGMAACYVLFVVLGIFAATTGGLGQGAANGVLCFAAVAGITFLVFLIWAIILVFRYRSALAYAAASARRSWAADAV